ncbi:bifunctional alpha/beta hydrolase/OsmC family protein [Idiomarina xiamenensis]|uniref:OsmC family protein n=1 Tax=Idiomarina xiamenensis 10-D-4 TaxID=740709 RepID=K2KA44_9GAMM|nr:alpha/beta fold hydrolase [Idiomarina xiamenensis]EKE79854.1 OsmC family protein [Idiomarina xiamenensis 10-D-4]
MREKITFDSQGQQLAGLLERPASAPKAYALFAHCFTCGKDIAAATRISRKLVELGFAVMRFDFTGLGNSDGDFSNTNFSSNLQDLLAAADWLEQHAQAPALLLGHSLGGAAVLSIAKRLQSVKAVVTIAAPATVEHVVEQFSASLHDIKTEGKAQVMLGPRRFTIKKQFLDDIEQHSGQRFQLGGKALLVMHSPFDQTVPISEAEKIYDWAKHPKSFISLDKADHLLTQREDAEYAANAIAGWASKYLPSPLQLLQQAPEQQQALLRVEEKDHKFTQTVVGFSHVWLADEPQAEGGQNLGPSPYEHLLAGLGACTAMTLRMYARHKQLPLDHVNVELSHQRNDDGSQQIKRQIELRGALTDDQRQRLLEIANKCPVHRTLTGQLAINTELLSRPTQVD